MFCLITPLGKVAFVVRNNNWIILCFKYYKYMLNAVWEFAKNPTAQPFFNEFESLEELFAEKSEVENECQEVRSYLF